VSHDQSPIKQVLNLAFFGPVGLALAAKDALPEWVDKGRTRVGRQVGIAKMVGEHASRHGQKIVSETLVSFGLLPGPPPPVSSASPSPPSAEVAPETRQRAAREAREEVGRSSGSDVEPGEVATADSLRVDPGAPAGDSLRVDRGAPAGDSLRVDRGAPAGDSLRVDPGAPAGDSLRVDRGAPSANGGPRVRTAPRSTLDSAELAIPGYDSLSASQVVQRLAGLAPPELEAVRTYEAAGRGRRTILTKIAQLQTGRT
jgi:hypothetical protein